MTDPLDIHVHMYAVARLAGIEVDQPIAIALRAILSRSFPSCEPPPVKARQRERSHARKQPGREGADVPIATPGKDFGFSPQANALWIIRDALPDFRDMPRAWKKRTTATMMFDRDHELWNALRAFVQKEEGFPAWRAGRLSLTSHLKPLDYVFFDDLFVGGSRTTGAIDCRGMPAIATRKGIVWIGLGDFGIFEEPTPSSRAALPGPSELAEAWTSLGKPKDVELLRSEQVGQDELLLLQIVKGIEQLGLTLAPADLVARIMEDFTNTAAQPAEVRAYRFKRALAGVKKHRWVEQDLPASKWTEQTLLKSNPPLPDIVDMRPELVAWLLRNPTCTDVEDWKTLLGRQAVSCVAGNPDLQRAIVNAVTQTIGAKSTRHIEYAQALINDGDVTLALECLERFGGDPILTYEMWAALGIRGVFERSVDGVRATRAAFLNGGPETIVTLTRTLATPECFYFLVYWLETFKEEGNRDVLRIIEEETQHGTPDVAINEFLTDWFEHAFK